MTDTTGMTLLACGCPRCQLSGLIGEFLEIEETIAVMQATDRLEMARDERELRVGMAGVKLLAGDVTDFAR